LLAVKSAVVQSVIDLCLEMTPLSPNSVMCYTKYISESMKKRSHLYRTTYIVTRIQNNEPTSKHNHVPDHL